MLYRPSAHVIVGIIRSHKDVFTITRWLRLPHQIYLGWLKTPNMLREPTPSPILFEESLKPGFYFSEYVH